MSRRTQRVGEALREILSELIHLKLKDPRIGFVTITAVRLTPDLMKADVYYTVLDPETLETTTEGLASAKPFLRTEAGRALQMRNVPDLHFIVDDTAESAGRIDELLAQLRRAETDE